jgi:hypothetical protein
MPLSGCSVAGDLLVPPLFLELAHDRRTRPCPVVGLLGRLAVSALQIYLLSFLLNAHERNFSAILL